MFDNWWQHEHWPLIEALITNELEKSSPGGMVVRIC